MKTPEPWLRGTLADVPFVQRSLLHAIEQTREDVSRWCEGLTDDEMYARPSGLPSIALQLRHIAGSLDRLLTYAEGRSLDPEQLAALSSEDAEGQSREELMSAFQSALRNVESRVRAFDAANLDVKRFVGRAQLPTTLGGLLIHCAEHTMRHVGQLITTAKVVKAARTEAIA
jgi:uncharacterized damage-inducible protein DinB